MYNVVRSLCIPHCLQWEFLIEHPNCHGEGLDDEQHNYHLETAKVSKASSIKEKGCKFFCVILFQRSKLTQNLYDPSFFVTSTIGEANAPPNSSTIPCWSIPWIISVPRHAGETKVSVLADEQEGCCP